MFARCRGTAREERGIARSGLNAERTAIAVADAARRWSDADFALRVRTTRAIVERTGYTEPVVDYALDALFEALDARAICAAIADELGSLDALERFVARDGRPDVSYRGVERATIVASDTTIGVAVPALAFALCAGARVVVKDRSDRLVAAFAETLVEERPELAGRIAVEVWDGASADAAANTHVERADSVVAFGSDAALRAIRARVSPNSTFVGFGHRTSIGYVTREALATEALARDVARGIARDALLYDGDGCLSLHAAFVEAGGAAGPEAFARTVAEAFDAAEHEFPAGYDSDPAAAAYARAASFRASQGNGLVFHRAGSAHVVAYDAPAAEPPPLARRTLALYPVHGPDEALAFVRRHRVPLEAVAFGSKPRADLDEFVRASGASRWAELGSLQRPPLGGEHGGHGRILPFVRAIYRG